MLQGYLTRARSRPAAFAAVALSLLVAACIFAPGKFTSQLDVRKDRTFAFRYTGEIVMLPLAKPGKDEAFEPETCRDEETFEDRACTPSEVADQKAQWEQRRREKSKSDAQAAQMLLGGLDPSDPRAGEDFAQKLRRQAGWNRVEYVGEGRFDVDYGIAGRLDHDFVFPTMEGFPMSNAFVQVSLRQDGSVRIDAPGFGPPGGGAGLAGMMGGLPGDDSGKPSLPQADGTFTILTDARILANNTDEGPKSAAGGQSLAWKVDPRAKAAPTALLATVP